MLHILLKVWRIYGELLKDVLFVVGLHEVKALMTSHNRSVNVSHYKPQNLKNIWNSNFAISNNLYML